LASKTDVYNAVGQALEAACLLEQEIGTSLLILNALETKSYLSPDADAYAKLRAAIDRNTLGKALNSIKQQLSLSSDIETSFSDALDARNQLVHRFFAEHGLEISTPQGRDVMLAHVTELHRNLRTTLSLAQDISLKMLIELSSDLQKQS